MLLGWNKAVGRHAGEGEGDSMGESACEDAGGGAGDSAGEGTCKGAGKGVGSAGVPPDVGTSTGCAGKGVGDSTGEGACEIVGEGVRNLTGVNAGDKGG